MCMGGPGCSGNKSKSNKAMPSAPKNWGGMKVPKSATTRTVSNSFGSPVVKRSMSFSGKARSKY